MRVLNDEVPDDGDFDAGRSRGEFDHITPEDITRGTGNPPGWLGADDIADLRSRMPIAYVEIVPVRVDDFGRVTQIGSLLRVANDQSIVERTLIAGRVPTDDIAQVNEQFEQMMAAEFDADDDLGIVVPHADSDDEMALNLTLDPEAFNRRLHIYAREQFEQAVQFLRHDLLRISGDDAAADELLRDHTDMEPLADMLALRLISTKRFPELLSLAIRIERERPNQQIMLFPETLVPYQWDSIREIALQGIDNRDELKRIYRERIVEAYDPSDTRALANLNALCSEEGDWDEQVRQIVEEYANGEGRYARNVIYEQMLIAEDMVEEAVEYVEHFPEAKEDLALLLW